MIGGLKSLTVRGCMRSFLRFLDCVYALLHPRVRRSVFANSNSAFRAVFPLALTLVVLPLSPARAQSFFDFLPWGQKAPEPSASTLPYELTVVVAGDEKGVKQAVLDASTLQRLRSDAPPDADALVRRAELDLPRVIDALWGAGYYNASVAIDIAGVPLRINTDRTQAAIAAAAAYSGRARAPVRIVVDPGRAFRLRNLRECAWLRRNICRTGKAGTPRQRHRLSQGCTCRHRSRSAAPQGNTSPQDNSSSCPQL